MRLLRESPWYAEANRTRVLTAAGVCIVLTAIIDGFITPTIGLGVLFLFPLILLSGFLARWQIVIVAAVGSVVRELLASSPRADWPPRVAFAFMVFTFVGFFISETVVYRRAARKHFADSNTKPTCVIKPKNSWRSSSIPARQALSRWRRMERS